MEFQQDCPKDKKNHNSFNFLPENLKKFRSTELYGAALEGSTIFLQSFRAVVHPAGYLVEFDAFLFIFPL